jgi:methyl-accepting chemotaxis protein
MKLTIGKQMALGFGAVILLMALSAGVAYVKVAVMNSNVATVVDQSFPTVRACDEMLYGLVSSVAALRSYMVLGDDPKQAEAFQKDRQDAWRDIDAAMTKLETLYEGSTDSEHRRDLDIVQNNLDPLRSAQQRIEQIAHTEDNIESFRLVQNEVAPRAERALAAVSMMMDEEDALEATPERKMLLKQLADFRYWLAQSLSSLRGYLRAADPELKEQFQAQWRANQVAFQSVAGESDLFLGGQAAQWDEVSQIRTELEPLAQQVFQARDGEDWNQANYLLATQTLPLGETIREALERLKESAAERVREDRTAMVAAGAAATTTLLVATLAAIVIAILVAVVLGRRIVSAVQSLLAGVQTVARGDLTGESLRVTSQDEIGQLGASFNAMVTSLRGLIADASTMTGEVASSSSEIATASQQQVSSLNQTATSLNQITTTAEEFKATMQEFADRAGAVQEAANETAKRAGEGRTLTVDSVSRIEQVRANSQAAGSSVLNLAEQVQRIGEITATVNEIAEQTKLLALNASIEAARAGEEGRGFAVVATQVRELANQSKGAGGRIESLIADTQKSMQDVVNKIEEGSRLSEDSAQIVRRVTQAFDEIAQAIEQTREAMSQINSGANQQEQGISELVASIAEIDSAMKESLTAAEQTQKSIVAIDQRIRALNHSVARFKT